MNRGTLMAMATMAAAIAPYSRAIDSLYDDGIISHSRNTKPKERDPKQLREYTYKGHTIMAYSKTDAKFRLRKEGKV